MENLDSAEMRLRAAIKELETKGEMAEEELEQYKEDVSDKIIILLSEKDRMIDVTTRENIELKKENVILHKDFQDLKAKVNELTSTNMKKAKSLILRYEKRQKKFIDKMKVVSGIYKGVTLRTSNSWRSRIKHEGRYESLGTFELAVDAAKAHDEAAIRLRGPGADCNF